VGVWVLHHRSCEGVVLEVNLIGISHHNLDAQTAGSCLNGCQRLWVHVLGHKESGALAAVLAKGHVHRLRGCGGLIQQGRIANVHASQIANHCLEVQQGFQTPLTDLSLVRGVGCVPHRVLQDVALDDAGSEGVVVSHADEGFQDIVLHTTHHRLSHIREKKQAGMLAYLVCHGSQLAERLGFGAFGVRECHWLAQFDCIRHGSVNQRIQRLVLAAIDNSKHGWDVAVTRAHVAGCKLQDAYA
jgi:hypothetical protein